MRSLLVLLLTLLPVHAFGATYALIGADLGTRGIGAELSLVGFDRSSRMWFGAVLGGMQAFELPDSHLFIGAEAGVSFVGVEAGLALTRKGARPRIRGLFASPFVTPYVEYLPADTAYAVGVLLKIPIKL